MMSPLFASGSGSATGADARTTVSPVRPASPSGGPVDAPARGTGSRLTQRGVAGGRTDAGVAQFERDELERDERSWLERINAIYAESGGDHRRIPWAHGRANPSLVAWLNAEAPAKLRPGARVAVVGCGLGHDAVALAERGYEVTAFDACKEAVRCARRLHPAHQHVFRVADLLTVPTDLQHRFEFVAEVHTLQALPPTYRDALARGMADLLVHGGLLVAIARGRGEVEALEGEAGPPFPLTAWELEETLGRAGLDLMREIDAFLDGNDPPVRRLRAVAVRRPR